MEANAFTGTCECNSTYNGNPVGENFSTEKVVFDRRLFKADMGAQFVQIIYPAELDPGTHDLVFVSEGVPQLQYHNGKKTAHTHWNRESHHRAESGYPSRND
ncbi:hypothetical protein HT737_30400 [Pseudomonas sp. MD195_PC81_125]|uniref:hypothetical protein n=1 Tax=Pseudomonas sp. MD195_PC81_125 TaxID=2741560 RepID=UPI0015FE4318|nr:hypothetical protein [Pseudomonas sp. MD195_PC81_125]MBA5983720.1 hypothetical protein [Pseudomonas sp. MD195_PC81_125]